MRMRVRTTVRAYSRRVKAVMGSAQHRRYRADMQGYHPAWRVRTSRLTPHPNPMFMLYAIPRLFHP
jgi:hypothetical protein